jgi:hypothetical protein
MGADNHTPTRQMRVEFTIGDQNYKPTRLESGKGSFPSRWLFLIYIIVLNYLHASLASVLKKLSAPLGTVVETTGAEGIHLDKGA